MLDDALVNMGQFITLFMIAVALGMDAFSLGIGVGMVGMRYRDIAKISLTIGLFHVAMPLLGIALGIYLSMMVGSIAVLIGGAILIMLGLHMLWNGLFEDDSQSVMRTKGFGLFLFAFSVSLDALSVGFSFGLLEVNKLLAVSLFGLMGGIMAGCGLLLGRRMGGWLGEYSEVFGGLILLVFGVKFIM